MAHYKILRTFLEDASTRRVEGMAYTAVPGSNNDAGVPWTEVAIGYMTWKNRRYQGGTDAVIPVDAPTQAALDLGQLFEWHFEVSFPTSHTNPQAIAAIEAGIDAQEATMVSELSQQLRYWGHEGDT